MAEDICTHNMPAGFTERDFEFAKLLKCLQVVGKNTMCDVAKAMYSSKRMNTKEGTLPLMSYMSKHEIVADLGDDDLMRCNIMKKDFDITFANKIITVICCDIYHSLSEACQKQIAFLVKFRNEMCHVYTKNGDMKGKFKLMKSALIDINRGVAKTLNKGIPKSAKIKVDDKVANMISSLQEIMDAQVTSENESDLIKRLQNYKQKMVYKVISTGIADIQNFIDKINVINPCTWADDLGENRFEIGKVFTPPELEDNVSIIEMTDLLTVKKEVRGQQVVPEILLLEGESGSGKTSFCRYLVHAWQENLKDVKGLLRFDLVLLVEIRRTTAKSIVEYLRDTLLKETFRKLKSNDVMEILKELNILFIIDGYDESNENTTALVNDIFDNFMDNKIILTTRTSFQEEVLNVVKRYRRKRQHLLIDLKGFNETSRSAYSEKVFGGRTEDHKKFQRYLNGRGRVLDKHLNIPLTVALLTVLWMDDHSRVNNVTTATSLYYELFRLFKDKLNERLVSQGKCSGRSAEDLKPILNRLLICLSLQAWTMLKEGFDFKLSDSFKKIVEEKCKKEKVDATEVLTAFLVCEIDDNEDIRKRTYYFLHKTQTEYLASLYLANSIEDGEKLSKFASEIEDWKKYEQLLVYLTGNMAIKETLQGKEADILDLVLNVNIHRTNYLYWWNIVSESRIDIHIPKSSAEPIQYTCLIHPKIGNIIANDARFLGSHVAWRPNYTQVAAALRLISLIPVEVESLNIEIPEDKEPYDIPDFLEAIEEVRKHVHGENVIRTSLLLWKHCAHECERTSDRFLKAMVPWAKLEEFTGSLEDSCNLKKTFPKLNNIRCKVTKPEVLKSFMGLRNIVRALRIILEISPDQCKSHEIKDLSYNGNLELCFYGIKDGHVNWVCDIVTNISRKYGCKTLELMKSEVSCDSLRVLVERLNNKLYHSLIVSQPDEDAEYSELQNNALFRIDFL